MNSNKISIVEKFVNFQGEGINIGIPYAFVRVGGCPLRCNYCDSEFTFQPGIDSIVDVDSVIEWCLKQDLTWISVTGGEPLIYIPQLKHILNQLRLQGKKTHVETSGRYYDAECHALSHLWSPDIKTPVTNEEDNKWKDWIQLMRPYDQVKCLIDSEDDLAYAAEANAFLNSRCIMILQPFNTMVNEENTEISRTLTLLEKIRWIADKTIHSKTYAFRNFMISPQLHVLAYGNRKGT